MSLTPVGLSTLDTFKAVLGVSGTSKDAVLTFLLSGASAVVEQYCGRRFGLRSVTDTLPGLGRQGLRLSSVPIVSVTTVTVDSSAITDYVVGCEVCSNANDGPNCLWRRDSWRWKPQSIADVTNDPDAQSMDRNIVVAYYGGYKLPGVSYSFDAGILSAALPLPGDVEMAAIRQAQYLYVRQPGVKSEKTPGGYSYENSEIRGMSVIDEIKPYLDPYRRYM